MMGLTKLSHGCSAIVLALLGASGQAWAADAPVMGTSADPTTTSGLEDIVVTARRRAESLQNVPATVSAISAAEIQSRDLTSLEKIAAATPQLSIGRASTGSGAQIVLRGVGSSASSAGIEQSVAVIVDGVYFGQGRSINDGMLDVERIEILKGPQALFFGKNATAGVIALTSADPGSDVEGYVRGGYEFASETAYGEGVFSAPLSDTLGIRVAVRGSKMYGGYVDNLAVPHPVATLDIATGNFNSYIAEPSDSEAPGERSLTGRLTLKWTPSDPLTVTLKAAGTRYRSNNTVWNQIFFLCPSSGGVHPNNPAIPCRRDFKIYTGNMPAAMAAGFPGSRGGELFEHYNSYSFTGTVAYAFDNANFTSVTNYQHLDTDRLADYDFIWTANGLNTAYGTQPTRYHAFSTENRVLTSYDGPVNMLFGLLFQKSRYFGGGQIFTAPLEDSSAPAALRYSTFSKESRTQGETLTPYGQLIVQPSPQIELTAGARYIYETKKSDYIQPYVNAAISGLFIPNTRVTADQRFRKFLPEFTASFRPNEDINIFAAYKTGYKSGGFSGSNLLSVFTVAPGDFVFGPESAKGFEVGFKSELFDRTLRLNVTAYRFKYSGLQVDFYDSTLIVFRTLNGGTARSQGVEAEFEWVPRAVDGLQVRGSVNYNRARYINFPGPCYSGQSTQAGCTLLGPGGAKYQDISGKPLLNAPRWTASLGLNYETEVSSSWKTGFSINARYSDDYLATVFGTPFDRQPAYVNIDASARIATADDSWELALIGKNLTNRFVITGSIDGPNTGSGTGTPAGVPAAQIGFVNPPRTVQLQGTFRF